jgi:hypothetical protein
MVKRKMSDLWFFFWPLCCLTFCDFSFDHCAVIPSVIFLLTIVLSDLLLWFVFSPLCCLTFCDFSFDH